MMFYAFGIFWPCQKAFLLVIFVRFLRAYEANFKEMNLNCVQFRC